MLCYTLDSPAELSLLRYESLKTEIPEETQRYIRILAEHAVITQNVAKQTYAEDTEHVTESRLPIDPSAFIVYRDRVCGYFHKGPHGFPETGCEMILFRDERDDDYVSVSTKVTMRFDLDLFPWAEPRLTVPGTGNAMRLSDYYMRDAHEIVIPDAITQIEAGVFSSFRHLQNVYYEGSPEQWCAVDLPRYSANPCMHGARILFRGEKLTELEVPESVHSLSGHQLSGFSDLTRLTLPGGIARVPQGLCASCASLETVVLKEGVRSVGRFAFSSCENLTAVYLPRSLETVGEFAFSGSGRPRFFYAGTREEWERIDRGQSAGLPNRSNGDLHFEAADAPRPVIFACNRARRHV